MAPFSPPWLRTEVFWLPSIASLEAMSLFCRSLVMERISSGQGESHTHERTSALYTFYLGPLYDYKHTTVNHARGAGRRHAGSHSARTLYNTTTPPHIQSVHIVWGNPLGLWDRIGTFDPFPTRLPVPSSYSIFPGCTIFVTSERFHRSCRIYNSTCRVPNSTSPRSKLRAPA